MAGALMGDDTERLVEVLAELSEMPAPPGHEQALGARVGDLWRHDGEVRTDRLGNTWRTFGEGEPHVVMLAHLDEVALVVRTIDSDGFLRVHRVGGIPERVLMAQPAIVLGANGPVRGVFGTVAHHLASEADKARVVPAAEQYLDVGAASRADAEQRLGVGVGDFIVYERTFHRDHHAIAANALDDRAGLTVLTGLAGRLAGTTLSRRVTLLASVQEEFNLRGLLPAIRELAPDLIISLDISPACDTPDLAGQSDVALGAGPVISHYSFHGRGTLAGVIPPRWLTDEVARLAGRGDVPFQRGTLFGGLTDASFAQLEGAGAPALEIGLPCRYTHAPVERGDLRDLSAAVDLLELVAREGVTHP